MTKLTEFTVTNYMPQYITVHKNTTVEISRYRLPETNEARMARLKSEVDSFVLYLAWDLPLSWALSLWLFGIPFVNTIACCCICANTESLEYLM